MLRSRIAVALLVALVASAAAPLPAQTFPPATKEAEAELLAVLTSADASREQKATACRRLAVVGTETAVPVLAGLLADDELSHMARYALEPMPYPSVDAALREALGKVRGRPLVGVIGSLGVRRDAKAVPLMTPLLGSDNADVAHAAARALGSIGTPEAVKALWKSLDADPSDTQRLALCEGLFRAAERMCEAGKPGDAVPVYDRLRGLKDAPHQVRTAAVRGAILARGRDGLPLLREYLASKDWIPFAAACRTTHEMTGSDVTEALTAVLGTASADHQVLAMHALGNRRDRASVPALMAVARAAEKPVRLAAIRTLAQVGDPSAAEGLMALLEVADREIADAALESLASLPGKEIDAAVKAMFAGGDATRRITAMALMGRRRMTEAVPDLLKAAADDDDQVRAAAMKHLGDLADPADLPTLLDLFMQASPSPVLAAAEEIVVAVCGKAEDPASCTARLVARLPNAGPAQKAALVRVLGAVGGKQALEAVREAASDADKDVHTTAIRALSSWKTPDVIPHLLAVAKAADDPRDRTLALRGYLGWASRTKGGVPGRERIQMCQTAADLAQTPGEKKLLLGTLGRIRSPQAMNMILPYLDDEAVRTEACAAAVSVAEDLLKVGGGERFAPKLLDPLQKVSEAATGDLAERAKRLLGRARTLAGAK